jgi:hypothetical protein
MLATISPETTEGYFDAIGVAKLSPFVVDVEYQSELEGFPGDGWKGTVVGGPAEYVDLDVLLTRRIYGSERAVVARVCSEGSNIVFSGICRAKGLTTNG